MIRRTLLRAAIIAVIALLPWQPGKTLSAQLAGQRFKIVPPGTPMTVGDSVTLQFRVQLSERDLLLDSIPYLVGDLPPGVRLLHVGKLTRAADRVFLGRATLAFYRPGRRSAPVFGLTFMRVVEGITRATLPSDSVAVEIAGVLPPGEPALKDIKEAVLAPPASLLFLLLALLSILAAALLSRRRMRAKPPSPPVSEAPETAAKPGAYEVALERLAWIEHERWPERGRVARHYEEVVQTLRVYLEAAEDLPAFPRTSLELLWALPPHLTGDGLRAHCHDILTEADLVKFAAVRPTPEVAHYFLRRTRDLLGAWHQADSSASRVDAVR